MPVPGGAPQGALPVCIHLESNQSYCVMEILCTRLRDQRGGTSIRLRDRLLPAVSSSKFPTDVFVAFRRECGDALVLGRMALRRQTTADGAVMEQARSTTGVHGMPLMVLEPIW